MALQQSQKDQLSRADTFEKGGDWQSSTDVRANLISDLLKQPAAERTARPQDPSNELETLGEIHKPTKRRHDYLRHFWRHFRDIRNDALKVLEIGVQTPRSVNMWAEFFPRAQIYGLDIDPACKEFETDRIKIFIGDQMDEQFLLNVITETGGNFDVVIDDGLHTEYSIMKSFSYLYPALADHGIYAIEDLQKHPGILAFLHSLMEAINFYPDDVLMAEWRGLKSFPENTSWLTRNTVGVSFYRYLAFIERGFNPEDNRNLVPLNEFRQRNFEAGKALVDEFEREGKALTIESLKKELPPRFHHIIRELLSGRN